ncbi:hypothetical protein NQ176_g1744 [Zarea fungicola]|uniref:Uncharacterized protein n=1 Tax=Zarea fungicola TaxID=93591 RepID=A0ACC1NU90_9HYPO|nr:hypothetical protein NQ176_g1744 [Lecanicillium fungicola]
MPSERSRYSRRHGGHEPTLSDRFEKFIDKIDPLSMDSTRQTDTALIQHRDHHNHGHQGNSNNQRYRGESPSPRHTYSDHKSANLRHHSSGKHSKRHSQRHSESFSSSQAMKSAAITAAIEALRARHDKDKVIRVATAAAASVAVDAAIGSKKDGKSVKHMAESTVAGLAIGKWANKK